MAGFDEVVIDQYSAFDHKAVMQGSSPHQIPRWVPREHERRLRSYLVAAAFHEQVSRRLLPSGAGDEMFGEFREYGDPSTLSARVSAGVIGTEMTFVVDAADDHLAHSPVLNDAGRPLPPVEPDPILLASHAAQVEVWEQKSQKIIDDWKAAQLNQPLLQDAQRWLREWSQKDRFESKLRECYQEHVQPMGDGVISFSVTPGEYPRATLWDPGDYFPVFPDGEVEEFADKVHLCYEYHDSDGKLWVRRATYELVRLIDEETGEFAERPVPYPGGVEGISHGHQVAEEVTVPSDSEGGTSMTSWTCILTDAHWKLHGKDGILPDLYDLADDKIDHYETTINENGEEVDLNGYDLGFDFIPIVHIPASPSSRTHFGRSLYLRPAMLFDDIAQNDTNIVSAATLAGNPPLLVSGAIIEKDAAGKVQMGPGRIFSTMERGSLDKLSMSDALTSLHKNAETLYKRLSIVSQIPEGVLGQVNAENVDAGITLALTFTPFEHLVLSARLALNPKTELIAKIVMRLAIIGQSPGWERIATVPKASIKLGAFMPTDLQTLVQTIVQLRTAGVLPKSTAVAWLEEIGHLNIEDAQLVIAELETEDTTGALDLEAMFGPEVAARYLEIEFDPEKHAQDKLDLMKAEAEIQSQAAAAANPEQPEDGRARPKEPFEEGEDPAEGVRR